MSTKKEKFDELVERTPEIGDVLAMKPKWGHERDSRGAHVNVVLDKDGKLNLWVNAHIDPAATGWYLSGERHRGLRCYLDRRSVGIVLRQNGGRLDTLTVSHVVVIDSVQRNDSKYLVVEIEE